MDAGGPGREPGRTPLCPGSPSKGETVLAVTCLTCCVCLARPEGVEATAAARSFLARHSSDHCLTALDLAAVRAELVAAVRAG